MTLSPASECPACGGPLVERPAHPYPVGPQLLFGASFVSFLIWGQGLFINGAHRAALVAWITVQIFLGAWLVRGRLRARLRILRCIRCGEALP